MSIGADDVSKIATLARIEVKPEQVEKLKSDLGNILNLVDQLQLVDTENVEPMAHPTDAVQVLRADEVSEKDEREAFQAIAPETEDGLYLVPKVID